MKLTTRLLLGVTAALLTTAPLLAADKKAKAPKPYPMDVCVVSDEKLGGMGEPVVFEYEGREVKLCCKSCRKDFDKDPAKFTAKVDAAAKKVKAYPAKTCLLSGEPLDESSPGTVFKGQEYKFCCKDCQKKFAKEPEKFTAKLPKS